MTEENEVDLVEVFESFLDGLNFGTDLLKAWNKFQKELAKSEQVATKVYKDSDKSTTAKPVQPSQPTPKTDDFMDLEQDGNGVYRVKKPKLEEKK